jgi:thiol-disulfide isomerase/thioredoxin
MAPSAPESPARSRPWFLWLGLSLALTMLAVRQPLQQEISTWFVLHAAAPEEAAIHELLEQARAPATLLERLWLTQSIPHRQSVFTYLNVRARTELLAQPQVRAIVRTAAHDADQSIRELALGILATRKDPELAPLALAQLTDADPLVRGLGLRVLGTQRDTRLAPAVVSFLDDPDPTVVAAAASALRHLTGHDSGIRLSQAVEQFNAADPTAWEPADLAGLRQGVQRWKDWWELNRSDSPSGLAHPSAINQPVWRLPAYNFSLPDLEGKTVRLSQFRGKVVLLNFWLTRCAACAVEIPELVELQKRYGERLVILGISLDADNEVHEPEVHPRVATSKTEAAGAASADLKVREQVRRFVRDQRLSYLVVLDRRRAVAARFNGNELPTNVLIDPEGYVRRRFLGPRSLATWEAMIQEASTPPASAR